MLVLLDNNFVDRAGFVDYMEASPDNRAAIPHTAFVEWHKGKAEKITRRVLQQACQYSSRIVILRDTQSILRTRGRPKRIMTRLIDEQQTRYFPTYCTTFITSSESDDVSAQFEMHGGNAREQAEALQGEAHKLIELFRKWDERFSEADLREMKGLLARNKPLSGDLQIKTWAVAEGLARGLLQGHKLSRLGDYPGEIINTLAFRYGAMTIGLYVRMHDRPGTYRSNDRNVLAHLMDIKIAAQGTYFDDFLTNETDLKAAYEIAMSLIRALGGFTGCGRASALIR
jgi:hypothetical protein